MSAQHARDILDAHEIGSLLDNEEEVSLLREHNPDLLEAYLALRELAQG